MLSPKSLGRIDTLHGETWPSELWGGEVRCFYGRIMNQDGDFIAELRDDEDVDRAWDDFIEGLGRL